MGRFGYQVIDADGHIVESIDMQQQMADRYMDRDRGPGLAGILDRVRKNDDPSQPGWTLGASGKRKVGMGRPLGIIDPKEPADLGSTSANKPGTRSYIDPLDAQGRLLDMDDEGIDTMVIFPSTMNFYSALDDVGLEAGIYQGYNRWMTDFCSTSPRLRFVAPVSMRHIETGVQEMLRAAEDPSVVGFFTSTHMDDKQLDHPDFHPLWRTAQELDVPITIHHQSAAGPPYGLGVWEMTEAWFQMHASGNPYEQMRAVTTIIGGGVLELFPKLRVAFLEAGCGWLPWWAERLDEHYELLPKTVPLLKHEPSHFFKTGRCFVSFDPDEVSLPFVLDTLGSTIVYASDYPHYDAKFPGSVQTVAERTDITDDQKRKVFSENPARLYSRVEVA